LSEELYETPREQFSQGDIFELLPHVFLGRPLTALTKDGETTLRAETEPFTSFDDTNGQAIVASCKLQRAILLSHDCEIDKAQVIRWILSPVVPIVRLSNENRDRVRRNRIYAMFHLPKFHESLPESFVDFNQMSTLNSEFVRSASRIVSLSDLGRRGMYMQLVRWFTRWELRTTQCPACGVSFNPGDVMAVRTP